MSVNSPKIHELRSNAVVCHPTENRPVVAIWHLSLGVHAPKAGVLFLHLHLPVV